MDVRAVIFDLGGTLWHWPRKSPLRDGPWFWAASYDRCARLLPPSSGVVRAGRDRFAAAMVAAEEAYRLRARSSNRSATPRGVVSAGLRRLGLPPAERDVSAALEGYGRVAVGWIEPFRDAVPTLRNLRDAGYAIGVLSNTWWSASWLDQDLFGSGLADHLDEVIYTSDLPRTKPHPSAFHEAALRLGFGPSECVMVGDDPLADVSGALDAGMYAVWKRSGSEEPAGIEPTATVDHLAALPALLH